MSISVEGQKCPVCGGYMFDEDDIVFCPQCGAPHHRECYLSINRCGLEEYHGTDKQYKKITVGDSEQNQQMKAENTSNGDRFKYNEKVCKNCGKSYPADQNICPHCGVADGNVYTPFGTPINIDPLGGVMPGAKIEDDITAEDLANYVTVNTPRYVPRFFKLHKKRRTSWNWGAFFFPHAWFFYRKIYFPGVLFFILSTVTSVMTSAINLLFENVSFTSYNEMSQYLIENMATLNKLPLIIAFVGVAADIFLRITASLFGDWFYRQSAIERIKAAKADLEGEDEEKVRIRKKGSVNIFLGLISLTGINWLVSLIFSLL